MQIELNAARKADLNDYAFVDGHCDAYNDFHVRHPMVQAGVWARMAKVASAAEGAKAMGLEQGSLSYQAFCQGYFGAQNAGN